MRLVLLPAALVSVLGLAFFGCALNFGQFDSSTGGAGGTGVGAGGPTTGSTTTTTTTGTGGGGGAGGGVACTAATAATKCDDGNPCTIDKCTAGRCSHSNVPDGTPTPHVVDVKGDCLISKCSAGTSQTVPDDTDVPAATPCHMASCSNGVPHQVVDMPGTSCPAGTCDKTGNCVGCTKPSDCGAAPTCQTATCTAKVCGTTPVAAGTLTADQTAGTCHHNQCDGTGKEVSVSDPSNPPGNGGNVCVVGSCDQNGNPGTTPVPSDQMVNGCAGVCDGAGMCVGCVKNQDCQDPNTCGGGGTPNQCGCTSDPKNQTCSNGACGPVQDNCNQTVDCGTAQCGAAGCNSNNNQCNCNPDSMSTTCNGKCGNVQNNCGMQVACGDCGGGVCLFNHTCCTPDPQSTTCNGKCGMVFDNCFQQVNCGVGICDGGTCNMFSHKCM